MWQQITLAQERINVGTTLGSPASDSPDRRDYTLVVHHSRMSAHLEGEVTLAIIREWRDQIIAARYSSFASPGW